MVVRAKALKLCEILECMREVLSESDDLRKLKYQGHKNPFTGHCYVASEAIYHLMGRRRSGLIPCFIRVAGEPHWFLKFEDGTVVDATREQFENLTIDYSKGTNKGFLTKNPSKRARELINRIRKNLS